MGARAVPDAQSSFDDLDPDTRDSAMRLAAFGDDRRKPGLKKRRPSMSAKRLAAVRSEVVEMLRTGDWESATSQHLVALYAELHARVYGVASSEVEGGGQAAGAAIVAAGRLVSTLFGGNATDAVLFMRWVWQREAQREEWRRQKGAEGGGRIGWKLQFARCLVDDYRLAERRARGQR